ncbi:MAG: hypothetical protein ACXVJ2_03245 [Candidatus Angelobacter sp.]
MHTQSASAVLARDFNDPDLSYLLLDEDGQVIAQRWEHPERDLPVGSLVKPFLAVAYGHTHSTYPEFRCIGKKTCWLPRGHGKLQIRDAIALSCNSYFHQLIADAGPDFAQTLASFPVHGPPGLAEGVSVAGWASPLPLAQAYLDLTRHARDAAVLPVLQGMALSAQEGTGKAAGAALPQNSTLAKTGTAPCTHAKKAPGDGFALVMTPADHPRAVLLVRLHGHPGSFAAGIAGRMLAAVEGRSQ